MNSALVKSAVACTAAVCLMAGCGQKTVNVPNVPPSYIAKVNGEKLLTSNFLQETYRRAGKTVLPGMIERIILLQWAKADGVQVEPAQIQKQIDLMKTDGSYEDQLKAVGQETMNAEIETMQARINLARKINAPKQSELDSAYQQMKQRFVHGAQRHVQLIVSPDKAKVEAAAKDAGAGLSFEEAAAKNEATPPGAGSPRKLWVDLTLPGIPKEIVDGIKATEVGKCSKVLTIAPKNQPQQYLLAKVLGDRPAENKKLADVKELVENAVLLQFSTTDSSFQKQLTDKKKAAKIDINDPNLKDLEYEFKYAQEAPPFMPGAPQMQPGR